MENSSFQSTLGHITHYQKKLEKYSALGETEKLLCCIHKLKYLPVTVNHLEVTGVGKSINALRHKNGIIGEKARALVQKWKLMVTEEDLEEQGEEQENYNPVEEEANPSNLHLNAANAENEEEYVPSDEGDRLQIQEQEAEEEFVEAVPYLPGACAAVKEENGYDPRTSREDYLSIGTEPAPQLYQPSNSFSPSQASPDISSLPNGDAHSDDSKADHPSSSREEGRHKKKKHKSRHDKDDKRKSSEGSSDLNHRKSKHHKSSSKSKDKKRDKDRDSSKSKHKSHRSPTKAKESPDHEPKESSDHKTKDKESSDLKVRNSSDNKVRESSNHKVRESSDHKSRVSSERKVRESSEHKAKDSSSDHKIKESSRHHKESSHYKESSHHHKESSHTPKESSDIPKESSRTPKESSHTPKEPPHTPKEFSHHYKDASHSPFESPSPSGDSPSSHPSNSSEKKRHRDPEEDQDINRNHKKHSKEKESHHSKKRSHKSKEEERKSSKRKRDATPAESSSGFEAALMGMDTAPSKKKKKKKSKDNEREEVEEFRNSSYSQSSKDPKEFNLDSDYGRDQLPSLPQSFSEDVAPPQLLTQYKPLPHVPQRSHGRDPFTSQMTNEEALNYMLSSKNKNNKQRRIYAGKSSGLPTVPSLFDSCIRVLQENIDALEVTGGIPFEILRPVLEKATPDQLFNLENYNPYLLSQTDALWASHCRKSFKNKVRDEFETWRELFIRCTDETHEKMLSVTKNLQKKYITKAAPKRQIKLVADVVAKPPKSVARAQARFANAHASSSSSSSSLSNQARPMKPSDPPRAGSSSGVSGPPPRPDRPFPNKPGTMKKPKMAPLMGKARQLMKKVCRR